MATSQPSILVSRSSDANWRALITAIHAGLSGVGLVKVTSTGEIDPTTTLAPTAANQNRGFSVWRFADSLQASYPVFFKFEFGSGVGLSPAIAISAGTGNDGAGTLTGTVGQRFMATVPNDAASAQTCYFGGDTNRFFFFLRNATPSTQHILIWGERLKATDGTDLNTGCFYGAIDSYAGAISAKCTWSTISLYNGNQCIEFGNPIPPPMWGAWPLIAPLSTTVGSYATSFSFGTTVWLIPVIPYGWSWHNPSAQMWGYLNGDTASLNPITTTLYGVSRSLMPFGGEVGASPWYGLRGSGMSGEPVAVRPMMANW